MKRSVLPKTIIALGWTSLLTDIGTEMIFPLLPLFLTTLGAGPALLGIIEGLADATANMLKLGVGEWSDRLRRRRPFVLFGYGLSGAVRPLMALATAPWHVLAVRVVDRIGKGTRTAPRDVILAAYAPKDQVGRAFGFHRAMDHGGAVLGPLVATVMLAYGLSMQTVFFLAVIPGLLALIIVFFVGEPPHTHVTEKVAPREHLKVPPTIKRFLGALSIFALGNSSDAFLLLRAKELGVSTASVAFLWSLFHVSKLLSSYIGGIASDRFAPRRLITAGWLVYATTYLGFALATEAWHAWVLFLVYGTYYGLAEPAQKALVKEVVPERLQGRAFGLYHFLMGIVAVPAGLLTGGLWSAYGASVALSVGSALALIAAISLHRVLKANPTTA